MSGRRIPRRLASALRAPTASRAGRVMVATALEVGHTFAVLSQEQQFYLDAETRANCGVRLRHARAMRKCNAENWELSTNKTTRRRYNERCEADAYRLGMPNRRQSVCLGPVSRGRRAGPNHPYRLSFKVRAVPRLNRAAPMLAESIDFYLPYSDRVLSVDLPFARDAQYLHYTAIWIQFYNAAACWQAVFLQVVAAGDCCARFGDLWRLAGRSRPAGYQRAGRTSHP